MNATFTSAQATSILSALSLVAKSVKVNKQSNTVKVDVEQALRDVRTAQQVLAVLEHGLSGEAEANGDTFSGMAKNDPLTVAEYCYNHRNAKSFVSFGVKGEPAPAK